MARTRRPKEPRRWTFMIVPARGGGSVWQREVKESDLRRAAVGAVVGGAAMVLLGFFLAPRGAAPGGSDEAALLAENRALRDQLGVVEKKVAEIEPLLDRVRAFDEQLRSLDQRRTLPGTGDWDADSWQARQDWIDGVVGAPAEQEAEALEDRVEEIRDRLLAMDLADLGGRVEDLQSESSVFPQVWPVDDSTLTSRYGWRRAPYGNHDWRFHKGIDLGVPYGTPVLSTNDGLVIFSGWDGGHGNMVVIDHGDSVASRYAHNSTLLVQLGDEVYAGDMIALAGSTGVSTGPHLHYELWIDGETVDPLPYLTATTE